MCPTMKCSLHTHWDFTGENCFFLYKELLNRDGPLVMNRKSCPLPPLSAGTYTGSANAATFSVSSYLYEPCLWGLVSFVSSIPIDSYTLSAVFAEFPDPWEEEIDEDLPCGTECSKVSLLQVLQL